MEVMLANDEVSHILSYLGWRDLIFCAFNINQQFQIESIKSLERLPALSIDCDSDDCFCIEYLKAHRVRFKRLSKLVITWSGNSSLSDNTQIINGFVQQYKSQLGVLNLFHSAQTIRMLSETAERKTEHRHDTRYDFGSLVSLMIHDYTMHSFTFDFFNLFANIRDLRIVGHLLSETELGQINACCKSLKCIQNWNV